jgi:hypothetical protein
MFFYLNSCKILYQIKKKQWEKKENPNTLKNEKKREKREKKNK